jgi:hypothetical protein
MEYQNIIIFVLIFIVLMTIFYFIISNFGINESSRSSNLKNIDELEKKVLLLNNELTNIKINQIINPNQITPVPSESNTLKEIIIETDTPIINTKSNNDKLNSNLILPSQSTQNKPPPIIFDPIANYDIAKLTDPLVDPRGRTSADQIPTPQVAAQFNFPTQGVLDRYHRVGLLIAIGSNKRDNQIYKNSRSPNKDYSDNSSSLVGSKDDIVWEGHIRKNRPKKARRYVPPESSETKSYKGIDIKENFDSDDYDDYDDSDSIEEFSSESNKNKIVNVYNNYSNQNDNNILELIGKKITDNWYKYFTSITMGNKIIKVVIRNNNRRELYTGDIVFVPEIGKSYRVKIDPMDMIEYNPYMF